MDDQELRDKLASEYCAHDINRDRSSFRLGWDAARANDASLRQTAGYELGRRAVEITENALHKCQQERDHFKAVAEKLAEALDKISSAKNQTIASYSEDFMAGANTAFGRSAETADEALAEYRKQNLFKQGDNK